MKKNPYNEILSIMDGVAANNQSPVIGIGQVISPPPNIKISYNGIVLEKDEIWISHYLLVDYPRTARGHIVSQTQKASGGSGMAEYAPHLHQIDDDYTDTIFMTDTLKIGEYVSVMPIQSSDGSNQQYIILDQIVRLDGR